MTPSTYVKNLEAHASATCYCLKGTPVLKYRDRYYTYREFFEAFPIYPIRVEVENNRKGKNCDTTKEWMHA